MQTVTKTSTDSAGLPVAETYQQLEPDDFTFAIYQITAEFKTAFRKLIARGLDVNRFIFIFRAETDMDGELAYDSFFIDLDPPKEKENDNV